MRMMWIVLVLAVAGIAALYFLSEDLATEFDRDRIALGNPSGLPQKLLEETEIARLPAPIQRYLRTSGSVGRPVVSAVHVVFDAELFSAPGSGGMKGLAHQIDFIDPPRRLFFMESRMYGLPVDVLHKYSDGAATMRVRLASLFEVANLSGPGLSKTETVTVLNDICAYAPSALVRPEFTFKEISNDVAQVTFANGPYVVSAILTFDEQGHLVDFRSEDRGELQKDGSLRILPWTTPLSNFRGVDGRIVPGRGEAIWHRAEGPFTYGTFDVRSVTFNQPELPG